MSEFDLSKLVREVHDNTDLTDYEQVAKEVRSRIPVEHSEAAFLTALAEYVRHKFVARHGALGAGGGQPIGYHPASSPGKPGNKSWKREGTREWWRVQLNQRYASVDGQKLLKNFTADDCVFQSSLLRDQAAKLETKAGQWDELGALLKLNKAAKVGDLP